MSNKVKITVIKKEFYQDLYDQYVGKPDDGICTAVDVGDTFVVTGDNYPTFCTDTGFCPFAWENMKINVFSALNGGDFFFPGWNRYPDKTVICCNDGIRPVGFLLEKFEA